MRVVGAFLFLFFALSASPVLADCREDIAAAQASLPALRDAAKTEATKRSINDARRELAENEEDECREAIAPALKIVADIKK